jgi:chemotaxis protein CheX
MERYIKPFIKVCTDVFKEMFHYKLEAGYPFFVTGDESKDWDISGVIGISGEAKGAVTMSMKTELAVLITSKLTGTQHDYLDDEVVDTLGEMVNIIAGNVKKELEEYFNLTISLPSIIKGKGHAILWSSQRARIMCIPFKVESHSFHLLVALAPEKDS